MILIVDFGSQTTHLIARRLKDIGIRTHIIDPEEALDTYKKIAPSGIILSGGPSSVYEKGSPTIDKKIFETNVPILGICYGFQLTSKLLGGKVIAGRKEYGPATIKIDKNNFQISNKLSSNFTVWQSHGDEVVKLPEGFKIIGSTKTVEAAFVQHKEKKIFGVQFHPEVEHTKHGVTILENFAEISGLVKQKNKINIKKIINEIKTQAGENFVIGAISGGVDSTVAGTLVAQAIGKKFIPVYVNNGLMRDGTTIHVKQIFKNFGINPTIVNCENEMLKLLKGKTDPEEKRKIIGNFYITVFERVLAKLNKRNQKIKFLLQGTIYSDVIESQGTRNSAKIKSHHNVGGLPQKMKLELLEPLRFYYKDEVRMIGKKLGLPNSFIWKQPFPGPGYAIRIRGEVTEKRLEKQRKADNIILEELEKAKILEKVFISFPVLTGASSTAVKGDGRYFGEVIALRIVDSNDVMTSTWSKIPYDVLQNISSRIVNEVPEVSRVVYDITTKPPSTMEWE